MSATRLRLVTYNIAHGRGLSPIQGLATTRKIRTNLLKIARLLHTLHADVVALQEIDRRSRWAGNFDHLDHLCRNAHYNNAVFGINNERSGLFNLSYGNALVSRYPIVASENIAFGRKRIGEKGFLFVELDVGGRIVPIINLHLHYSSRELRLQQLDRLTEWLSLETEFKGAHWHMPPIICGDFNTAHAVGDATNSLMEHLQGVGDYKLFPLSGHTFPSPWPQRSLDFVILPHKCHRPHAVVVKSMLSDHRPVMVEFEL